MLTKDQVSAEAQRLHEAETNRTQVKATTLSYPDMSIEDAYKVQSAWMEIKKSEGRTVAGYKIGLTS